MLGLDILSVVMCGTDDNVTNTIYIVSVILSLYNVRIMSKIQYIYEQQPKKTVQYEFEFTSCN